MVQAPRTRGSRSVTAGGAQTWLFSGERLDMLRDWSATRHASRPGHPGVHRGREHDVATPQPRSG